MRFAAIDKVFKDILNGNYETNTTIYQRNKVIYEIYTEIYEIFNAIYEIYIQRNLR